MCIFLSLFEFAWFHKAPFFSLDNRVLNHRTNEKVGWLVIPSKGTMCARSQALKDFHQFLFLGFLLPTMAKFINVMLLNLMYSHLQSSLFFTNKIQYISLLMISLLCTDVKEDDDLRELFSPQHHQ